jgi:hypothetical protein
MKKLIIALMSLLSLTVYANEVPLQIIEENGNTYYLIGGIKNLTKNQKISFYCMSTPGRENPDMIITIAGKEKGAEHEILARVKADDFRENTRSLPEYELNPRRLEFYMTESTFNSGHGGASTVIGFLIAGVVTISIDLVSVPFQLPFIFSKKNREARATWVLNEIYNRNFYKVTNKNFKFIIKQIKRLEEMG